MPGKHVAVQPAAKHSSARRRSPLRVSTPARARTGFLVTSASFELLYANAAAFRILSFPRESNEPSFVEHQLRAIFPLQPLTGEGPVEATFVSGRRTYICRPFPLVGPRTAVGQATLGVLLERPSSDGDEMLEVRRRFHLSPREFEAVQYLVRGLTTKEVAGRMNVSPNTVKQYVRLVMSKMRVTTRAGIVGKLLTG